VVGGGLVGVETSCFLSKKGKKVTLIEMLEEVGRDAGPLNRARLREELSETDIDVRCKTRLMEIGPKGIKVQGESGEYFLVAGSVVLALGATSRDSLSPALKGKISELYAIGDGVAPRRLLEAVHEAFAVASKI
jgi:pyruvate/2-oxoglutarate dehydrogenase complex dihydrolipoamide dehydrogenase (E3) component